METLVKEDWPAAFSSSFVSSCSPLVFPPLSSSCTSSVLLRVRLFREGWCNRRWGRRWRWRRDAAGWTDNLPSLLIFTCSGRSVFLVSGVGFVTLVSCFVSLCLCPFVGPGFFPFRLLPPLLGLSSLLVSLLLMLRGDVCTCGWGETAAITCPRCSTKRIVCWRCGRWGWATDAREETRYCLCTASGAGGGAQCWYGWGLVLSCLDEDKLNRRQ